MNKTIFTRQYKEKDKILIFDEVLDQSLSTYDPCHLEELVKAEADHFWLITRRDKVCDVFIKLVEKTSRILKFRKYNNKLLSFSCILIKYVLI